MGTRYSLNLPAAQVLLTSGHYVHLYQHAPIPKDVAPAQLDHLLLLEAVTAWDDGLEDVVDAEIVDDGLDDGSGTPPVVVPDAVGVLPRPAQLALKADWVDYVVSRGTDRAEAEGMTKPDLIRLYPEV